MLALVNSPSPVRLAPASMPIANLATLTYPQPTDAVSGVPSCAPLVQHELLRHLREHAPYAYLHANREFGLTLERTEVLVKQRQQVISAARALKLARLVAAEPNGRAIFGETGHSLYDSLHQEMNRTLKCAVRTLPRSWRQRAAFSVMRRYMAYKFAGTTNHLIIEPHETGAYLTLRNGLFADRLETLSGAHAYYRNLFETMLQQFAHIDCEVVEIRRPRVHPHQCDFKVVWES